MPPAAQHRKLQTVGKTLNYAVLRVTRPLRDAALNHRYVRAEPRIALVRHPSGMPSYYKIFLKWIAQNVPDVRERFELRLFPWTVNDASRYALVVPWIPESLLVRSPSVRQQAMQLTNSADTIGIPIINRPSALLKISKLDAPPRMSQLGVRTPNVCRINDIGEFRRNLMGLTPPLLVREELGHNQGNPIIRVNSIAEGRRIPLEDFESPIVVEFVDARSPDGLVRKYRYMAMGDLGISHSLQISNHWEVRGGTRSAMTDALRHEEVSYSSSDDKNHELFQHVRRGLELDFVAFDYSYDQQGQVVVWEINVLPGLDLPTKPHLAHVLPPYERAMAATLKLYLERAGLDVPRHVDALLKVESPFAESHVGRGAA